VSELLGHSTTAFLPSAARTISATSARPAPARQILSATCWDIAPLPRSRDQASLAAVNIAAIELMEACLALGHDACRESALHGLGENHWFVPTRPRVHAAIDAFLARSAGLRPELVAYPSAPRAGHVL
jgi:hypothetical protein